MTSRKIVGTAGKRNARTVYLLNQAHFATRLRVEEALKAFEISALQYTVLSLVGLHPALSSAELSRRFFRTQQAMGQLLSGLQERGWLMREEDPTNRRMLRITLTDAGQAMVKSGGKAIDALEEAAFSRFSEEEIRVFRQVLESLVQQSPPGQSL